MTIHILAFNGEPGPEMGKLDIDQSEKDESIKCYRGSAAGARQMFLLSRDLAEAFLDEISSHC
jgi:hypothetical protein